MVYVLAYFTTYGNNFVTGGFLSPTQPVLSAATTPQQLQQKFIHTMTQRFPQLREKPLQSLLTEQVFCPFVIELPQTILRQAQGFARALFHLRCSPVFQQDLLPELQALGFAQAKNFSILMSYDFHLRDDGQLQLIEVNTNASFMALAQLLYETHSLPLPVADFSMDELRADILQELQLNGFSGTTPRVLIVDEQPEQQRMYAEFLLYAEFFRSWGWACRISDVADVGTDCDFIYNRSTDFLLSKPHSQALRQLYTSQKITLSPHPAEYLRLADKQRLTQWSQPSHLQHLQLTDEDIQILQRHIGQAFVVNRDNAEQVWSQRRQLFFKPLQSYGGKQSYAGSKISHKLFNEMTATTDFLAQQFVPAPELTGATEQGPMTFKYDLRFYVYQGRVQSAIARVYQGQVTNLKTLWGGFAPLRFL